MGLSSTSPRRATPRLLTPGPTRPSFIPQVYADPTLAALLKEFMASAVRGMSYTEQARGREKVVEVWEGGRFARRSRDGQGSRTERQGRRAVREAAREGGEQAEGGEDRQHLSLEGSQARREVG